MEAKENEFLNASEWLGKAHWIEQISLDDKAIAPRSGSNRIYRLLQSSPAAVLVFGNVNRRIQTPFLPD